MRKTWTTTMTTKNTPLKTKESAREKNSVSNYGKFSLFLLSLLPRFNQRSEHNRRRVAFSTTHHTFEQLPKEASNDVLLHSRSSLVLYMLLHTPSQINNKRLVFLVKFESKWSLNRCISRFNWRKIIARFKINWAVMEWLTKTINIQQTKLLKMVNECCLPNGREFVLHKKDAWMKSSARVSAVGQHSRFQSGVHLFLESSDEIP
jgi:hypothetical protein